MRARNMIVSSYVFYTILLRLYIYCTYAPSVLFTIPYYPYGCAKRIEHHKQI